MLIAACGNGWRRLTAVTIKGTQKCIYEPKKLDEQQGGSEYGHTAPAFANTKFVFFVYQPTFLCRSTFIQSETTQNLNPE